METTIYQVIATHVFNKSGKQISETLKLATTTNYRAARRARKRILAERRPDIKDIRIVPVQIDNNTITPMENTTKSAFLLVEWEIQKPQVDDVFVPMGLFSTMELAEKAAADDADWYVIEMEVDKRYDPNQ